MVSITVPCREIDEYTRECVEHCLRLEYPNFEVIVLPDHESESLFKDPRVRVIATKPVLPPVKRNVGWTEACGEIVGFLDSDSYPPSDWLKKAIPYFENPRVWGIGGPGVNPPDIGIMEKASGLVMSSLVCSGSLRSRYKPVGGVREVNDWITCNMLCRRSALESIGGFDPDHWPGDDTMLVCEMRKHGGKMLYVPHIFVYHHRRPLFRKHLRQVAGFKRGAFFWLYPETSRKPIYFLPTLFLVGLVGGLILSLTNPIFGLLYILAVIGYFSIIMVNALLESGWLFPLVATGIFLTHMTYGISFLYDMLSIYGAKRVRNNSSNRSA